MTVILKVVINVIILLMLQNSYVYTYVKYKYFVKLENTYYIFAYVIIDKR